MEEKVVDEKSKLAEFNRLILHIATNFINIQPDEIDSSLNKALNDILNYTDFDRAFVRQFDEKFRVGTVTHHCCKPGGKLVPPHLITLSVDPFDWWVNLLRTEKAIIVQDVEKLPADAENVANVLRTTGDAAIMAVPIKNKNSLLGYIAFTSRIPVVEPPVQYVQILKLVGSIFCNALLKFKSEKALRESELKNRLLSSNFPDGIISIIDEDLKITFIEGALLHKGGITPESLLGESILSVLNSENAESIKAGIENAFRDEIQRLDIKEGKRFYKVSFVPLKEANHVSQVMLMTQDITQQKRTELQVLELLNKTQELNQDLERRNKSLIAQEKKLETSNKKLKKQRENLEKTLQELNDRNFELDQLIYKISHDIRSPVVSIMGLVNLSKNEQNLEHVHYYSSLIETSIIKLEDFVKSLIYFAQISRRKSELQLIDFNVLLNEVLEELSILPGFSRINFKIDLPNEKQDFVSDVLQLKIILSNILSNSILYVNLKADAQVISIKIALRAKEALITIWDNGIGIEAEQLKRVFDMFYRGTEKSKGSGLGLFIVNQAVKKLHGTISLTSKINEETEIKIIIPSL